MIKLNKIIKNLVFYDFLIYSSWGLVSPVFAIFVLEEINSGSASVAGIALGLYWGIRGVLQYPVGRYLDTEKGEHDGYWLLLIGATIASFIPLLYIYISQPWHLYILQLIHGASMALAVPAWGGIFMRNIDKGKTHETWSLETSLLGIGLGITGVVGGSLLRVIGFEPLFIIISLSGFLGVGALLVVKEDILTCPEDRKGPFLGRRMWRNVR